MSYDFRFPNITANTEAGQLLQLKGFLHELVEQLNWAMNSLEKGTYTVVDAKGNKVSAEQSKDSVSTFNDIKGLIIKSADIVNAYSDEITKRLEGLYVAQSDFGTYREETAAVLSANSTDIDVLFKNTQTIESNVDSINGVLSVGEDGTTVLGTEAWVKIGILAYDASGFPIYGMEIGQKNDTNGSQTSKRFAQYRSDGVHLFDQNDNEVATISNHTLSITNAKINSLVVTDGMEFGGYKITTDNGLTFKWGGTA